MKLTKLDIWFLLINCKILYCLFVQYSYTNEMVKCCFLLAINFLFSWSQWEAKVTQYERDFERVSATVRKEVIRFEVLVSDHAACTQKCQNAHWWNVSMQSQKEKAKKFKSQIIKYLESLLQSQQQVRVSVQTSLWTKDWNKSALSISRSWLQRTYTFQTILSFSSDVGSLSLPPADQILGGFLAWS